MQTAIPGQQAETSHRLTISFEWIAYLALAALALALRLSSLDIVPLTQSEAQQALAAWQTLYPIEGVQPPTADSPLLFALHKLAFTVLGGTEFVSRLATALAGAALVVTPLLFKDIFGRVRTFCFTLLLAASPVLLAASRFSSPVIWSMLFAVLMLWSIWRLWQTRKSAYGALALVLLAITLFLTDVGALWLALTLLLALVVTLLLMTPPDDDVFPGITGALVRERFASVNWLSGLGIAALTLVLVSTALLTYPAGLSSIGELLTGAFRGLSGAQPGYPALYALNVSLFYEPFYWLFAIIGVVLIFQRDSSLLDRFFVGWLLIGLLATILFRGGEAAHALWLTLPLAALTSRVLASIFEQEYPLLWDVPGWVRPLLALIAAALMAIFAIGLQLVARSLLRIPSLTDPAFVSSIDAVGSILVLMVIMFFIVGFFLVASLWDTRTAASGGALGILIFGMLTSLGSGWNAAVTRGTNPAEYWHLTTTTYDLFDLRQTLIDVARRETRGMPTLPIYAEAPTDGLVAWALRDFTNVYYIDDLAAARGQQVVILSSVPRELAPDLGGGYIGQDFTLRRSWQPDQLQNKDSSAWWLQRETTILSLPLETVVLWLREDIYHGADLLETDDSDVLEPSE